MTTMGTQRNKNGYRSIYSIYSKVKVAIYNNALKNLKAHVVGSLFEIITKIYNLDI